MKARGFLSRLLPARLQRRTPMVNEDRLRLLAGVTDTDACLKVVLDIVQELLESEFHAAIDPERPAEQRLRACDGMRIAYFNLHRIEAERASAKAWREEQDRRQKQA